MKLIGKIINTKYSYSNFSVKEAKQYVDFKNKFFKNYLSKKKTDLENKKKYNTSQLINKTYFDTQKLLLAFIKKKKLKTKEIKIIKKLRIKFEVNLNLKKEYYFNNLTYKSKKNIDIPDIILLIKIILKNKIEDELIILNLILKYLDCLMFNKIQITKPILFKYLKEIIIYEKKIIRKYL